MTTGAERPAARNIRRAHSPWIGAFVGLGSLSVTADVCSHGLLDETEVDYARLLADA